MESLSLKDMPAAGEARAAYVKLLAKCLYPADKDDFLGNSSRLALEGLLLFYIKAEQAMANDYFLSGLLEKGRIAAEDRTLLEAIIWRWIMKKLPKL